MEGTLYRRPLPANAVAFASEAGRRIFAEALASNGLNGYFPLAEQFHTQSEPSYCGLGSLVVALNALAIDPERLWKGPWRWFSEDLLDCCVPLEEVRERGLGLDELACLARCNGAEVDVQRADTSNLNAWRAALATAAGGDAVLVAAYDRAAIGQTGSGHFSPIGGYHGSRDLALILDVARFKYPPHWVSAEELWRAMQPVDPDTGLPRGWMVLRRRARASTLGFSVRCAGEAWQGLRQRLAVVQANLSRATDLETLARATLPLAPHLEVRRPGNKAHQQALDATQTGLRSSTAYPRILAAIGPQDADAVTALLYALADDLSPTQRRELGTLNGKISDELGNLRAQLAALSAVGPRACPPPGISV